MAELNYIFGPVPSRRLGFSLGIDPIPFKTCTLDCVYCQLGKTTHKTLNRKVYLPTEKIMENLKEVLSEGRRIDFITFSGSGEPTLHLEIGKMIEEIKRISCYPVAILTNGTLLTLPEVREELKRADLVIPSLDTVNKETFQKLNRPHPQLEIEKIVEGLINFRKIYEGGLWIEIMIVDEINDTPEEILALKRAIEKIKPDKVQINVPTRPPSEKWVKVPEKNKLNKIKELLGSKAELISEFRKRGKMSPKAHMEEEILSFLMRRPATLNNLSASLGIHKLEVLKYIEILLKKGKITEKLFNNKIYFVTKRGG